MSLKNYEIANIETSNVAKQNIPQKKTRRTILPCLLPYQNIQKATKFTFRQANAEIE